MEELESIRKRVQAYRPSPLLPRREYAVLLPLIYLEDCWQILYEVRSEFISQPGEVSFPGGRMEQGETAQDAALRETFEELSIPKEKIDLLGELDYWMNERRTVRCFVGQIQLESLEDLRPNEEVARVFTIPLNRLIQDPPQYYSLITEVDPESDFPFEKIRGGIHYPFTASYRKIPFYEHFEELIWGMTAEFTDHFIRLIKTEKKES